MLRTCAILVGLPFFLSASDGLTDLCFSLKLTDLHHTPGESTYSFKIARRPDRLRQSGRCKAREFPPTLTETPNHRFSDLRFTWPEIRIRICQTGNGSNSRPSLVQPCGLVFPRTRQSHVRRLTNLGFLSSSSLLLSNLDLSDTQVYEP